MKIHQITFSPTGGTKRVAACICEGIGTNIEVTELCLKAEECSTPEIAPEDLAVIAVPVFAGRVPPLAIERLRQIESHGACCAVAVVYGNRAYDDALLELHDVTTEQGFRVIAAIGAVAEHSIIRKYGQGRPDAADEKTLRDFGKQIAQKAASGNDQAPAVPGKRPYKKPMAGPHPKANSNCNGCGICANACPTGAISPSNPKQTDAQKCISCMKCVAACPSGARGIGKVMTFLIAQMIKKPCAARKANELYI